MNWPTNDADFAKAARDALISEMASTSDYWIEFGRDVLINPQAAKPYERSWSEVAKRDRSYRDVFASLTSEQRDKVIQLLKECVSGAVFGSLCTLDQFPGGEAELWIWDDVCGNGQRKVKIAPTEVDLHDEFKAKHQT